MDGTQFPSHPGHKRGRSDDMTEFSAKRQRNEVSVPQFNIPSHDDWVNHFTEFIEDKQMAAAYVQRLSMRKPPVALLSLNTQNLVALSPANTLILSRILNGVLPAYYCTLSGNTNDVCAYMTRANYDLVKAFLVACFPFISNGPQPTPAATAAFNDSLNNIPILGGHLQNAQTFTTLNQISPAHLNPSPIPQPIQIPELPQGFPQSFGNYISHLDAMGWNQVQSGHPNAGFVPSLPQPMQPLTYQTNAQNQARGRFSLEQMIMNLTPQQIETEKRNQDALRLRQQMEQGANPLPVDSPQLPMASLPMPEPSMAGNFVPLRNFQAASIAQQSSTAPSRPPSVNSEPAARQPKEKKRKRKAAPRPKRIGDGTPGSSNCAPIIFTPPTPGVIEETQSDSAVLRNQRIGQQLPIQSIGHPVPVINTEPGTIPRPQTVSGYRSPQTTTRPALPRTLSTSPISPIAARPIQIPSLHPSPLGKEIIDLSASATSSPVTSTTQLRWDEQSQVGTSQAQNQEVSTPEKKYTFINHDPTHMGSSPSGRRSGASNNGKQSVQGGAVNSPKPNSVSPPVHAQREEEEEEEEMHPNKQISAPWPPPVISAVGNFSIPLPVRAQPVDGDLATGLSRLQGIQRFGAPTRASVQQRVDGATTPISPLTIPGVLPSNSIGAQASSAFSDLTASNYSNLFGPEVTTQADEDEWSELAASLFGPNPDNFGHNLSEGRISPWAQSPVLNHV